MDQDPDSAAVFACALSLHAACLRQEGLEDGLCLSDAYDGMDQFMREVMRVAGLFENWSCKNVAFEVMDHVWPYLLEKRFGTACIEVMNAGSLVEFNEDDCLRVAFKLRIPLRAGGALPVPVCVEVPNPAHGAGFVRLRIQTIREELGEDAQMVPFTEDDEPFDEYFGTPFFGVYGVGRDGLLEHIADRKSYEEARTLLENLIPELQFSERAIAFGATDLMPGAD